MKKFKKIVKKGRPFLTIFYGRLEPTPQTIIQINYKLSEPQFFSLHHNPYFHVYAKQSHGTNHQSDL